jgi:hypothetical protein
MRGQLVAPRRTRAVAVSAVIRRGQLAFVYTVDPHTRARLLPVSTGAEADDVIEVLAGIREGP